TGDRRSDARRGRFVLVVLLLAVAWPPGAAAAVLAAAVRLVSVRRRRARAELDAVWAELPEVVELLALAVGAGLTPAHALGAVSNLLDGPVSRSFGEAIARTGAGERLADALAGAAPGVGHPSRPVFDALVAAER